MRRVCPDRSCISSAHCRRWAVVRRDRAGNPGQRKHPHHIPAPARPSFQHPPEADFLGPQHQALVAVQNKDGAFEHAAQVGGGLFGGRHHRCWRRPWSRRQGWHHEPRSCVMRTDEDDSSGDRRRRMQARGFHKGMRVCEERVLRVGDSTRYSLTRQTRYCYSHSMVAGGLEVIS